MCQTRNEPTTKTKTVKVGGLTKAMMHRIGLSVKLFRRIYQTALWCCRSCDGIERQGQNVSGQLPACRQAGTTRMRMVRAGELNASEPSLRCRK